jgi:phosphatidylglycerol---prolipoprotein diacylglyceryl transferase
MHPILFSVGGINVYSYGFLIAVGAIAGVSYMAIRGKAELGLSFDKANNLFLLIFIAAFVGGKVFLFFEEPSAYAANPQKLLSGRGFVFYGSFLFAIPTMAWFFKRNALNPYKMLDIMAITTCLVHMFGRVGCFMAGCCYGTATNSFLGIEFHDPACYADPLNVPLHPVQLYEASYIFLVMIFLVFVRSRRQFYGQMFLLYLILYGVGRFMLEYIRGDAGRGFIVDELISHSQFIALCIMAVAGVVYLRWYRTNKITAPVVATLD